MAHSHDEPLNLPKDQIFIAPGSGWRKLPILGAVLAAAAGYGLAYFVASLANVTPPSVTLPPATATPAPATPVPTTTPSDRTTPSSTTSGPATPSGTTGSPPARR